MTVTNEEYTSTLDHRKLREIIMRQYCPAKVTMRFVENKLQLDSMQFYKICHAAY